MKINIIFEDIFSIDCDAYVTPTDPRLSGSGGLDKTIHIKAGPKLQEECANVKIQPGETFITSGGNLPVKYILHTASPRCSDETQTDYPLLCQCYQSMLSKASGKSDLHHLAVPLVGTGVSGYSLDAPKYANTIYSLTAVTILSTLLRFRSTTLHTVTIVCSSKEKYDIMQRTFQWICGRGISKRSRIQGSLLGGAVGDALGYPVEFHDAADSRIQEYHLDPISGKALISDDTQMTLFTACGLLYGYSRIRMRGIGSDLWNYISLAYQDWLKTQCPNHQSDSPSISWIRNIPELQACRAPGMTCLSALKDDGGSLSEPINNSKGCGGVMRITPVALYLGAHDSQDYNLRACAETAAITHGHPLGWLSAAALGNILFDIMQNFSLHYAVQDTIVLLRKNYSAYSDTEIMIQLLTNAADLADISGNTSSYDLIAEYDITKQLGEGWVGEEALAVGLFCAMASIGRSFEQCLHNAVWHKGDSDSTASIAGQIWGAYFGVEAIPAKWLVKLELRQVITEIANDLTDNCRMCEYGAYYDSAWVRKYLSADKSSHIPTPNEPPPLHHITIPWSDADSQSRTIYGPKGKYEILIENGSIYHVSQIESAAHTGAPGFGFVTLKYYDKKQAYTEHHGWVKKHGDYTIAGYYNNKPFNLVPNVADNCVEIFSHVSPTPWIGSIRRNFTEYGNPIEITFRDQHTTLSIELLKLFIFSSDFLRNFFCP